MAQTQGISTFCPTEHIFAFPVMTTFWTKSIPLLLPLLALAVLAPSTTNGHSHRHLKKGSDENNEEVVVRDRPGFTGDEWFIADGTAPWDSPESEFVDQRAFVESGAPCGTRDRSEDDERSFEKSFRQWKIAIKKGKNKGWFNGRRLKTVVIPTYFHVITDGWKGDVTEAQIDSQVQVLNDSFGEAGFRFLLMKQNGKGASRTSNKKWHEGKDEYRYKARLRKGGENSLNVYINEAKGYLGYAYYPSGDMAGSILDGCVIHYSSLPDGRFYHPYNEGDTLVHEVGHWLNLPHTFLNGCSSTGDFVADTPAEAEPAFGCPIGRDTCKGPGHEGLDPVTNFMDYTDDDCMDNFTPMQIERMHAAYDLYRDPGFISDDPGNDEGDGVDVEEEGTPSDQPSASPVATVTTTCEKPGNLCRKKKDCCSGLKCKKDKKTKVKMCK